jgi:hypothetical protein
VPSSEDDHALEKHVPPRSRREVRTFCIQMEWPIYKPAAAAPRLPDSSDLRKRNHSASDFPRLRPAGLKSAAPDVEVSARTHQHRGMKWSQLIDGVG